MKLHITSDVQYDLRLGYLPSDMFLEFLRNHPPKLGLNTVKILDSRELPQSSMWAGALGLKTEDSLKGILSVYVNTVRLKEEIWPTGSWELVCGHEILHSWLRREGFPIVIPPEGVSKESPQGGIADRLGSLIDHPRIQAILKKSRMPAVEELYEHAGPIELAAIRRLEDDEEAKKWVLGMPGFSLAILLYLEYSLMYPSQEDVCGEILEGINPLFVKKGLVCLKDADEVLHGSPDDILSLLKRWRRLLRIENRVTIVDIRNNRRY